MYASLICNFPYYNEGQQVYGSSRIALYSQCVRWRQRKRDLPSHEYDCSHGHQKQQQEGLFGGGMDVAAAVAADAFRLLPCSTDPV
jgi:hypothetical protein